MLIEKIRGLLEGAVRREIVEKNQGFAPDCSLPALRVGRRPQRTCKSKIPPLNPPFIFACYW